MLLSSLFIPSASEDSICLEMEALPEAALFCFSFIRVGLEGLPEVDIGFRDKFYGEKKGCSYLSKTRARVTLSSLGSSSMGVFLIFSKLRCRSFSG